MLSHGTDVSKFFITNSHWEMNPKVLIWVDACYASSLSHMYAMLNVIFHVCINCLWLGMLKEMHDLNSMIMWVWNESFPSIMYLELLHISCTKWWHMIGEIKKILSPSNSPHFRVNYSCELISMSFSLTSECLHLHLTRIFVLVETWSWRLVLYNVDEHVIVGEWMCGDNLQCWRDVKTPSHGIDVHFRCNTKCRRCEKQLHIYLILYFHLHLHLHFVVDIPYITNTSTYTKQRREITHLSSNK